MKYAIFMLLVSLCSTPLLTSCNSEGDNAIRHTQDTVVVAPTPVKVEKYAFAAVTIAWRNPRVTAKYLAARLESNTYTSDGGMPDTTTYLSDIRAIGSEDEQYKLLDSFQTAIRNTVLSVSDYAYLLDRRAHIYDTYAEASKNQFSMARK